MLLFLTQFVYGQGGGQNNMATRILNTDYINNKNSQSLADVKGSPFLNDSWQKGYLYLTGGGSIFVNKLKLNGYTGELHYIDEKGVELAPIDGAVTKVHIHDPKDSTIVINKYYAFTDRTKNNRKLFFEVHNEGAIQIVSRIEKFIFTENYDPLKGKTAQYFKNNTVYAIAYEGNLTFINELNYANVMNALPKTNNKGLVNKKYKLKTLKEVIAFLDELNY